MHNLIDCISMVIEQEQHHGPFVPRLVPKIDTVRLLRLR